MAGSTSYARCRAASVALATAAALAGCSAAASSRRALENCLHVCGGNRACEYECREDTGTLDDAQAAAPLADDEDDGGVTIR